MYYSVQILKVESDFKETALVSMNKVKIPKKYGGNHTEIIKLSELVTIETIKEEMIKVAGDRMLDPPPRYNQIENCNGTSLEIEKERTKQKEIENIKCIELTKQKEIENMELTKQKQLELEMKKIELEMKKMDYEMLKLQSK
jgi:hypothetical protein